MGFAHHWWNSIITAGSIGESINLKKVMQKAVENLFQGALNYRSFSGCGSSALRS
jgi:hypothetical protein